jgi:hypothetical protein
LSDWFVVRAVLGISSGRKASPLSIASMLRAQLSGLKTVLGEMLAHLRFVVVTDALRARR